jgi:hypothetical protein
MPRRLQLLWIPLLAALIAGTLATGASGNLASSEVLRAVESIGSAPLYSVPTARSVLAIQTRPQPYRHGGSSWAAVPGDLDAHAFEPRLLAAAILAGRDALARTARHFPLFPTGPPAHS